MEGDQEYLDPAFEEELQQYWKELLEEIKGSSYPLSEYTYKTFVSTSSGRNRKKRNWREVELIGLPGGRIVSVINGRFPKTKKTRMDSVAEEALGESCPPHIQPLEHFLNVLRERDRRSKKSRG